MPIINGIKMACEPCIRGHRSTKCNHANERVMLPVRKPGRPLSICPHPPNNGCSCASVTAAIPRTRKCTCGTKNGAVPASASSSNAKAPRSPSKRGFYKAPTSPKFAPRTRIDPGALGRTDISQMNIHGPPSSWTNRHTPANMDSIGVPGGRDQANNGSFMLPADAVSYYPHQDEPNVAFPRTTAPFQNGYHMHAQEGNSVYTNGNTSFSSYFGNDMDMSTPVGDVHLSGADLESFSLHLNQPAQYTANSQTDEMNRYQSLPFPTPPNASSNTMTQMAVGTAAPKPSCCASKAQASLPGSSQHTPTSSTNSLSSHAGTTNASSCCSGSPTASSAASRNILLKREVLSGGPGAAALSSIPTAAAHESKPATNGSSNGQAINNPYMASQLNSSVPLDHQPAYANFAQQGNSAPAWYRYTAEYGTVTAPLQVSQWRPGLTGPTGAGANGMFSDALQFGGGAAMQSTYSIRNGGVGDADGNMCTCGDDCECVGCVTHPYNNATRNTIQSAWNMMDDASSTGSSTRTIMTNGAGGTMGAAGGSGGVSAPQVANTDSSSPQQVPTPSDASGTSDDQISLPTSDFLFVSYPIMGCDGEGLTCPCGDDCQCVGCTIHNNVPN